MNLQQLSIIFVIVVFSLCPQLTSAAYCGANKTTETINPVALLATAKKGDVAALTKLGAALLIGDGIERNEKQGVLWLKKAVKMNSSEAQYLLGKYYSENNKLDTNHSEAISLWQKSAMQGYPPALFSLGVLHSTGDFGVLDLEKSQEFLTRAAEAGYAPAQIWVGSALIKGKRSRRSPENTGIHVCGRWRSSRNRGLFSRMDVHGRKSGCPRHKKSDLLVNDCCEGKGGGCRGKTCSITKT